MISAIDFAFQRTALRTLTVVTMGNVFTPIPRPTPRTSATVISDGLDDTVKRVITILRIFYLKIRKFQVGRLRIINARLCV